MNENIESFPENVPTIPGRDMGITSKTVPTDHEMMVFYTMAENAVASKMYRGIGEKAGVMMVMLAARELGIPPMQALNGGLNIIQGKVEISARMMNGLIRRSGHQISVKENTDDHCVLIGKRTDTGEVHEVSFSVAEAQKAGLIKPNGGWQKFPKDMCYARALSRLARQLFPDVIGIGYVEGEIKALELDRMPEIGVPEISPEIEESSSENLQKLLEQFNKDDHYLVMEYLQVIMKHFGWTQSESVKKLLEDKSLIAKFDIWKGKRKIS